MRNAREELAGPLGRSLMILVKNSVLGRMIARFSNTADVRKAAWGFDSREAWFELHIFGDFF